MADSSWQPKRIAMAALVACAIAACAFVYRFNTLGGTLGGFDNDHFIYLIRTDMVLAGEQPLRDFVDAELRGAWPALTYSVSAWAQQLGGRTLLPEAYLTVGLLALAYAITFLVALDVSKRWSIALLAAAAAIVTAPKLYNAQKVIVLALGVWAIRAVVRKPSVLRLATAAAATAVAALFRHDYGLYLAAGMLVALATRDVTRWTAGARSIGVYVGLTAAFLLPSLLWVQFYAGLREYAVGAVASVVAERTRTPLILPDFDTSALWSPENMELVTYNVFWGVSALAVLVLFAGLSGSKGVRLSAEHRATGLGILALAVLVTMSFLRANLAERFGDAAVAVVLLAAWIAGVAPLWVSPAMRRVMLVLPILLLLEVLGASYILADTTRELDTSGLSDSWGKIVRRYGEVRAQLGGLPPTAWSNLDANDPMRAARYLAECTAPDDRVLVIGPIHEIPVLARRHFAAGQAMFKLSLYLSEADQERALARLQQQSVPVVIADAGDFDEGFVSDYPLVAKHVASHYRDAGSIDVDHEPRYRIFVTSDREPARTDPVSGLPCFK
jgi:hypothetical protein